MFRRTRTATKSKMPSGESEEARELRKCKDRLRKAQKRKSETVLEAEARRAYYRQCTAKTRVSETVEEAMYAEPLIDKVQLESELVSL